MQIDGICYYMVVHNLILRTRLAHFLDASIIDHMRQNNVGDLACSRIKETLPKLVIQQYTNLTGKSITQGGDHLALLEAMCNASGLPFFKKEGDLGSPDIELASLKTYPRPSLVAMKVDHQLKSYEPYDIMKFCIRRLKRYMV
jgi:hypothetical protein